MVPNPFKPAYSASENPAFPGGDGHRPVRLGRQARSGRRQSIVKGMSRAYRTHSTPSPPRPCQSSCLMQHHWQPCSPRDPVSYRKRVPFAHAHPLSSMHQGVGMSAGKKRVWHPDPCFPDGPFLLRAPPVEASRGGGDKDRTWPQPESSCAQTSS